MILKFDTAQTLTLAIVFFMIGNFLKNKIKLLNRLCIPSPIIGGILFSLLNLIFNNLGILKISISAHYTTMFIYLFFTTIGLGISTKVIKTGGNILIKYWVLCAVLAFSQNILVLFVSKFINIDPLLGLMCGSISMEGGHGYAAAFGQTIENLGIEHAVSFGITAATLGLIFGGVLGGPVAKFLIEKYRLKPNLSSNLNINHKLSTQLHINQHKENHTNKNNHPNLIDKSFGLNPLHFMEQLLIILICINVGEIISKIAFKFNGFVLPVVVTCMFVAVIFRNFNDKFKFAKIDFKITNFIGEISLGLFLTISLMNIDLYKLSSLLPLILFMVVCQVVFIILYGIFVCFRVLGKSYDAAVIISGLIGHGIGATPNAMANMSTVTEKYGPSPKAILVVPLVSSFLLDIVSVPCILFFINLFS
ncbi:sodium/glutamate symporter [Clostridioides mangenotii]|uniref:sodium/glutamate symporter n=1 Tax=Metaclostridioides mangenotii TaxID=1540 RepID=UPI00214A2D13|nr:sodium/glutamate symporter [Clostridioides mangenotii]MCR1954215.1 sodium/glutamate symporter [Clostridioides mangenotii]